MLIELRQEGKSGGACGGRLWWGGDQEQGEEEFKASLVSKGRKGFDWMALKPQGPPKHVKYRVPE